MPLEDLLGLGGAQEDALAPSVSGKDAQSLALIQALQQTQQAGLQRTASPIGSIAQALIPLFAAPIQAKQMQQKAMLQDLLIKLKLAQALKGTGDDKKTTAEVAKLEAETGKIKSEQAWKDELRKDPKAALAKLMGAVGDSGGAGMSGMKSSALVNPETGTASVRFSSDVLSPERFQQQKDIQAAGQSGTLANQKELARYRVEDLPAKLTQKQQDALDAGTSLIGMLDEIPGMVQSLPKDIDRAGLARQAAKYQGRSEHPMISNLLTGLSGGMINADTDPRLDPYFATVGQTQSALSTFNLAGMRGGYNTLKWLNVHFPGWGDDASAVERKAKFLSSNKGLVRQKIEYLQGRLTGAAKAATDIGGEPVGDMVRVKVRHPKTGQTGYMMIDPETGQSSSPEPDQAATTE